MDPGRGFQVDEQRPLAYAHGSYRDQCSVSRDREGAVFGATITWSLLSPGDLESPTILPCNAVAQYRSCPSRPHPRRAISNSAPTRTPADRLASGERFRGQWTAV